MYICVDCGKEMRCEKTGAYADFGGGHIYPGDAFKCDCGNHIIATRQNAGYFPKGCGRPVVTMVGCFKTSKDDPDYV